MQLYDFRMAANLMRLCKTFFTMGAIADFPNPVSAILPVRSEPIAAYFCHWQGHS
jgi:hypothetical protein